MSSQIMDVLFKTIDISSRNGKIYINTKLSLYNISCLLFLKKLKIESYLLL